MPHGLSGSRALADGLLVLAYKAEDGRSGAAPCLTASSETLPSDFGG